MSAFAATSDWRVGDGACGFALKCTSDDPNWNVDTNHVAGWTFYGSSSAERPKPDSAGRAWYEPKYTDNLFGAPITNLQSTAFGVSGLAGDLSADREVQRFGFYRFGRGTACAASSVTQDDAAQAVLALAGNCNTDCEGPSWTFGPSGLVTSGADCVGEPCTMATYNGCIRDGSFGCTVGSAACGETGSEGDCSACPAGKYTVGRCSEATGCTEYSCSGPACKSCVAPANRTQDDHCLECNSGHWFNGMNCAVCSGCPVGQYNVGGCAGTINTQCTAADWTRVVVAKDDQTYITETLIAQGLAKTKSGSFMISWSTDSYPTTDDDFNAYEKIVRFDVPLDVMTTVPHTLSTPTVTGTKANSSRCVDGNYFTQVDVSCVKGDCKMPSSMYAGTGFRGICYDSAFGLVYPPPVAAEVVCDLRMETPGMRALYIDVVSSHTTACHGVQDTEDTVYIKPKTMALWRRSYGSDSKSPGTQWESSDIVSTAQQQQLSSWSVGMMPDGGTWKRCYKKSLDSNPENAHDFESLRVKCDRYAQTFTVIKLDGGKIVGGTATKSWGGLPSGQLGIAGPYTKGKARTL